MLFTADIDKVAANYGKFNPRGVTQFAWQIDNKNLMINLKTFPTRPTQYALPLIIIIIAFTFHLFDDQLSSALIFDREAIANGDFWRIFTGHFFHTNLNHLLLNIGACALLWSLHGQFYSLKNYAWLVALSALGTSAGIYFFSPDIFYYVGLSGVLHGVFVWGAVKDIQAKEKTGYLLFLGVWLKVAHEQIYGASSDVEALISSNVAIDAHLFGAISGLIIVLFSVFKAR